MSEQTHTPEPLTRDGNMIEHFTDGACDFAAEVLGAGPEDDQDLETLDATTDRLVACYNDCEGINPKAVPKLLKAASALIEALELTQAELYVSDEATDLIDALNLATTDVHRRAV